MVTVVMAGAESSSDFSSSIRATAGASDDKSFKIFLQGESAQRNLSKLHFICNYFSLQDVKSSTACVNSIVPELSSLLKGISTAGAQQGECHSLNFYGNPGI